MTLTATDLAAPLARYARRLHALAGPRHHVASPLGAWLLLALCAPAAEGQDDIAFTRRSVAWPGDAAELAASLLASPHPLVPAAAAVWHSGPASRTAVALAGRAAAAGADRPADHPGRTGPLGPASHARPDRPVPLDDPSVHLLVATVLATRVSWQRPFDLAPASALGPSSPWAALLSEVLRTPDGTRSQQFVAATGAAGDVAVHTAVARGGLRVTSVAAAPGVPAGDVLAAAYDLAPALATGGRVARRSLFDLPLGDGPLWAISERTATIKSGAAREERCTAVLPAWTARPSTT